MKTGVQRIYNYLKELDSGFRRNDEKTRITTFYETISIGLNIFLISLTHYSSIPVLQYSKVFSIRWPKNYRPGCMNDSEYTSEDRSLPASSSPR